jgi:hypothetical protein
MIILLLSKYSESCNKLIDTMRTSGINFDFIDTIFIDNISVRKAIMANKKMGVRSVPTILVFKPDNIEKYDKEYAFIWMYQTIKNIQNLESADEEAPPSQAPPSQAPPSQAPPSQAPPSQAPPNGHTVLTEIEEVQVKSKGESMAEKIKKMEEERNQTIESQKNPGQI